MPQSKNVFCALSILLVICLFPYKVLGQSQAEALLDSAWNVFYSKPELSLEILDDALAQAKAEKNHELELQVIESQGMAYDELNYSNKAMELYLKVLEAREAAGEEAPLVSLHLNLGIVYDNLQQMDEALFHYREAKRIAEANEDQNGVALASINLGTALSEIGNYDESIKTLAPLARDSLDDYTLGSVVMNLGLAYHRKGALEQAIASYRDGLSYFSDDVPSAQSTVLSNLGKALSEQGNWEEAEVALNQSIAKAKASDNLKILIESNTYKADLLENKGDYAGSLALTKETTALKDSLARQTNQRYINTLDTVHDVQKKEASIASLQAEKQEKEKRILLISSVAIVVLLILIVVVLITRNRLKTHAQEQTIQALELEKKDQDLQSARDELNIQNAHLTQKSLMLQQLQSEFQTLQNEQEKEGLIDQLDQKILTAEDWSSYKRSFSKVYPRFFESLKTKSGELSEGDLRTAALMKQGMSTAEIGKILGISDRSAVQNRYRLKKKLGFEELDELLEWLKD